MGETTGAWLAQLNFQGNPCLFCPPMVAGSNLDATGTSLIATLGKLSTVKVRAVVDSGYIQPLPEYKGISPFIWGVSLWEALFCCITDSWIPFPTAQVKVHTKMRTCAICEL